MIPLRKKNIPQMDKLSILNSKNVIAKMSEIGFKYVEINCD